MRQDQSTYLLMYSPVRTRPHVWHLKQVRCHWRSRASRDCPCLISSPQPAQSGGDECNIYLPCWMQVAPDGATATGLQSYRVTGGCSERGPTSLLFSRWTEGFILQRVPVQPLPLMNGALIKVEVWGVWCLTARPVDLDGLVGAQSV